MQSFSGRARDKESHSQMTLDEFIAELSDLDDHEKLEFLVDLADELPPVSSERSVEPPPQSCRVQECQTAVYLWVDVIDGRTHVEADVPRNAPTVRGLVTLVVQLLEGLTPQEVLQIPEDLLPVLGLQTALGMQRQQGLRGVVARIQRDVRRFATST